MMKELIRKFSQKPAEEIPVQIILCNLISLSYIHIQMSHYINSVANLMDITTRIEKTVWRIQSCCPPPSNHRLLTESDLGYQKFLSTKISTMLHSSRKHTN